MPYYDYLCRDCGGRFEKKQKMSDDPLTLCPDCGGRVRRVISGGAGVVFKGSGFYATDYGPSASCRGESPACDNPKRCCESEN